MLNNLFTNYAVATSVAQCLTDLLAYSHTPYQIIKTLLQNNESNLTKALIKIKGEEDFINLIVECFEKDCYESIKNAWQCYTQDYGLNPIFLTGAEAIALILRQAKVKNIFAYPGTSELALCDSILRTPDLNLINGRGDKESAFMAAGGSLLSPNTSIAILHGARGITNAAGAIATARRNEIGTVFFVGLPSTKSSPFLPPHGELNLIKNMGNFVKASYEITEIANSSDTYEETERKATDFVYPVKSAIWNSQSLPLGPTLIGIPQDALEQRWIFYEILANVHVNQAQSSQLSVDEIESIVRLIKEKEHPLILVDDYLFKTHNAKEQLVVFAETIGAPVLQIHYKRGPMLFERISAAQNPYFIGPYDCHNEQQRELMRNSDLLITLEDRNAYPRVVGQLPYCSKIALTSNAKITKKNRYLKSSDILAEGNVVKIMTQITEVFSKKANYTSKKIAFSKYCKKIYTKTTSKIEIAPQYKFIRSDIAEELGNIFKDIKQPILVDDSQMLGGVLAENYDKFPDHLRVIGDHSAFVGAGLSCAAGLALSNNESVVFCTLGDQAFTNSLQGLVAVIQNNIKVIYIICNNGRSVSLTKQAISQNFQMLHDTQDSFLANVPNFSYEALAKSLGIKTFKIQFNPNNMFNHKKAFREALLKAIKLDSAVLIELILPSDQNAWLGIWTTEGKESHLL